MKPTTVSNDNLSLSNNSGSALTQFIGQDGSEFVINTTTGAAFISQRAAARVLEINERTVRRNKEEGLFTVQTAEINTVSGLRCAALISAKDFYKLAEKYKPEVAEKMLEAGANVFIYGLAGYKLTLSESEALTPPQFDIPKTLSEALLLASELSSKLEAAEAKIEADSEATALGEYLNKGDGLIGIGDMARILEVGRSRYFIELRECGIIMKGKTTPYQHWLERGYFKVTEMVANDNSIVMVTLVTPKGQLYLSKRHKQFLENEWMLAKVEREVTLI